MPSVLAAPGGGNFGSDETGGATVTGAGVGGGGGVGAAVRVIDISGADVPARLTFVIDPAHARQGVALAHTFPETSRHLT